LLIEIADPEPLPGNSFGLEVAVGDLGGDAAAELAIATSTSDNQGRVHLFSATGDLIKALQRPASAGESFGGEIVIADLIGDGDNEIVVSSSGRLHLFTSNGIHISDLPSPSGFSSALEVGDFNGDGREDLAVGVPGLPTEDAIHIYTDVYQEPTVVLQPPPGYSDELYFPRAMASGDSNADGRDELWASSSGYPTGAVVSRYAGSGILEQTIFPPTPNPTFGVALAAGDIDGDGRADVAAGLADYHEPNDLGKILVFDSDGDVISSVSEANLIGDPHSGTFFGQTVAMGDVTADGRSDVFAAAPGDGLLFVLSLHSEFVPEPEPVGGSVELATGKLRRPLFDTDVAVAAAAVTLAAVAALRLTRHRRS
jgi:hypothetical protein